MRSIKDKRLIWSYSLWDSNLNSRTLPDRVLTVKVTGIILISLLFSSISFAMPNLRKISINNELEVSLIFDSRISNEQLNVEYQKENIQITIKNVSIYPPKMLPVNGKEVLKIFAYQYAPKLVRCRISVKGNAQDYKEKLMVDVSGSVAKIKLRDLDQLVSEQENENEEDARLVEKISHADTISIKSNPEMNEVLPKTDFKTDVSQAKSMPTLFSITTKLGMVLFVFGFIIFFLRKLKSVSNSKNKASLINKIKSMTSGKFSQETEIIEILSNYYLDPKKRIVVVRVGSSILVLGITNESINLITQLSDESEPTQIDDFSKLLQSEGSKPSPPSEKKADLQSSLREQIKHRVERLKPL